MRYFEPHVIFLSVLVYALYGAACGALQPLASRLATGVLAVLRFPRATLLTAVAPSRSAAEGRARACLAPARTPMRHVEDFLFVFLCGIGFLLLTYILLDGMLRLFGLAICIALFFISRATLGRLLFRVYDRAALFLFREGLLLTAYVLYPAVHLCRWVFRRAILPPCRFIYRRRLVAHSRRRRAKKLKTAREIFTSRTKSTKRKSETFDPLAIFMQTDKNPLNESFFVDKNNKK